MTAKLVALKQIQDSMVETQKCDDVMLKEVGIVADRLERYMRWTRVGTHYARIEKPILPTDRTQMFHLSKRLAVGLGENPYSKQVAISEHRVRVRIIFDPSYTADGINLLREKPPLAWHGAPGGIEVMHNGYDAAVVWGAGLDGQPVFDRSHHRYKLVSVRLSR